MLIALLVLWFVVRPLVRRIVTPESPRHVEDRSAQVPRLPPPDAVGDGNAQLPALATPQGPSRAMEALQNARIEGEVQAYAIRDVGGVVQNHRDEAVSIVRQWIRES